MGKPFLIINHHRSGSNFLCRLIKSNKELRCLNEPLSQHMNVFEEYDLISFDNGYSNEVLTVKEKLFLKNLKKYMYESPNIVGFKDTCLYGKMNWVLDEFKGIKVIHLVRNPIAVINSCLRNDMWRQWNYEEVINRYRKKNGLTSISSPLDLCIESWKIRNKLYFEEMQNKEALTIKLESLVLNTEKTLQQLMDYLEAEVSDNQIKMINECYKQKKGKEYSVYRRKEDVISDWKKCLNEEQVKKIKEQLSDEMCRYGYV